MIPPFSSSSTRFDSPPVVTHAAHSIYELTTEGKSNFSLNIDSFPPSIGVREFCNLLLDKYLRNSKTLSTTDFEGTSMRNILPIVIPVLQQILKEEPDHPKLPFLIDHLNDMLGWERATAIPAGCANDPKRPLSLAIGLRAALRTESRVYLPFAWRAIDGGHQLIFGFIKEKNNTYRWEIYNTGKGIGRHWRLDKKLGPKDKVCPRYTIDEIPEHVITSPGFFEQMFENMILKQGENKTSDERVIEIYGVLKSVSQGRPISPLQYFEKYGENFDLVDPQDAGTCVPQVLYAFMLLLLDDRRLYSRIKHRLGLLIFDRVFRSVDTLSAYPSHYLSAALRLKAREATRYYNAQYLSRQEYLDTVALIKTYQDQVPKVDNRAVRSSTFPFSVNNTPPSGSSKAQRSQQSGSIQAQSGRTNNKLCFDTNNLSAMLDSFINHLNRFSSPLSKFTESHCARTYQNIWNDVSKIRESILPESGPAEGVFSTLFKHLPDINDDYWLALPLADIEKTSQQLKELIEATIHAGDISGLIYSEYLYSLISHLATRQLKALYPGLEPYFENANFGGWEIVSAPDLVVTDIQTGSLLKSLHVFHRNKCKEQRIFVSTNVLAIYPGTISENKIFQLLSIMNNSKRPEERVFLSATSIAGIISNQDSVLPRSFWNLWEAFLIRSEPCLKPYIYPIDVRYPYSLFLGRGTPVHFVGEDMTTFIITQRMSRKRASLIEEYEDYTDYELGADQNDYLIPDAVTLFEGRASSASGSINPNMQREFHYLGTLNAFRFPAVIEFINKYKTESVLNDTWAIVKYLLFSWDGGNQCHPLEHESSLCANEDERNTFLKSLKLLEKILTDHFLAKYDSNVSQDGKMEILESISLYLMEDAENHPQILERLASLIPLFVRSASLRKKDINVLERWVSRLNVLYPTEQGNTLVLFVRMQYESELHLENENNSVITPEILELITISFLYDESIVPQSQWAKVGESYENGNFRVSFYPLRIFKNDKVYSTVAMSQLSFPQMLRNIFGNVEFFQTDHDTRMSTDGCTYERRNTGFCFKKAFIESTILRLFPKSKDVWNKLCSTVSWWYEVLNFPNTPILPQYAIPLDKSKYLILRNPENNLYLFINENIGFLITRIPNKPGQFISLNLGKELLPRNKLAHNFVHPFFQNLPFDAEEEIYVTCGMDHDLSTIYLANYQLTFSLTVASNDEFRLRSHDYPSYYVVPTPFQAPNTRKHVYLSSPQINPNSKSLSDEDLEAGDKLMIFMGSGMKIITLPMDEYGYPIGSTIEENMLLVREIAIPNNEFDYAQRLIHACKQSEPYTEKEIIIFQSFLTPEKKDLNDLPEVVSLQAEVEALVVGQIEFNPNASLIGNYVYLNYVSVFRHIPPAHRLHMTTQSLFQSCRLGPFQERLTTNQRCVDGGGYALLLPNNGRPLVAFKSPNERNFDNDLKVLVIDKKVSSAHSLDNLLGGSIRLNVTTLLFYALERIDAQVRFTIKTHAYRQMHLSTLSSRDPIVHYGIEFVSIFLIICMEDPFFHQMKDTYDKMCVGDFSNALVKTIREYQPDIAQKMDQLVRDIHTNHSHIIQYFPTSERTPLSHVVERFSRHLVNRNTGLATYRDYREVLYPAMQTETEKFSRLLQSIPLITSVETQVQMLNHQMSDYFEKRTFPNNEWSQLKQLLARRDLTPSARLLLERLVTHCEIAPATRTEWVWRDCSKVERLKQELRELALGDKSYIDHTEKLLQQIFLGNSLDNFHSDLEEMYREVIRYGTGIGEQHALSPQEILKWIIHTPNESIPADLRMAVRNLLIFRIRYQSTQKALALLNDSVQSNEKHRPLTTLEIQFVEFIESCRQFAIPSNQEDVLLYYQAGRRLVLKPEQLNLVRKRHITPWLAIQAASGGGKTDVIAPLLITLQQALKEKQWVILGPDPLHETTYRRLQNLLSITTYHDLRTFSFRRRIASEKEGSVCLRTLFNKSLGLDEQTPVKGRKSDFQSLLLHYFEVLLELASNDAQSGINDAYATKLESIERALRNLRNNTKLLCDEGHEFFNPFVNLNYEYGEPELLDPSRWMLGIRLFSLLDKYDYDFQLPEASFDIEDYNQNVVGKLIDGLVKVRDKLFVEPCDPVALKEWLKYNSCPTLRDVDRSDRFLSNLSERDKDQALAIRAYLYTYLPQCLQAKSLSDYGLGKTGEFAIRYHGKENPSNGHFELPDITIALTSLMLLKQGLSQHQMGTLVKKLKSLVQAVRKQQEQDRRSFPSSSSSSSFSSTDIQLPTIYSTIHEYFHPNLERIDETSEQTILSFHTELAMDPEIILTYLELCLFPSLSEGTQRLTANSHDVATVMFNETVTLSATVNNYLYYPVNMKVDFDPKTDSDIISHLLNPRVCQVHTTPREEWLSTITDHNTLALADPCDTLKGVSSESIARVILEIREDLQGVALFDTVTKEPVIIYRDGNKSIYASSIHRNLKLFVYFDGPHCTGSDFPLPPNCAMVLLADKDITWTMFAQTAKRTRNLGEKGQTIAVHLTLECEAAIRKLNPQLQDDNAPNPPNQLELVHLTVVNEGATLESGLYPALTQMITANFRRELVTKLLELPTSLAGLTKKRGLVQNHIALLRETILKQNYLEPGMIAEPVSLAEKIKTMIARHSQLHPDLACNLNGELRLIQDRANVLLSGRLYDASSRGLYSTVEVESQTSSHKQAFGMFEDGRLTPVKTEMFALKQLYYSLKCFNNLLEYGMVEKQFSSFQRVLRLTTALAKSKVTFASELFASKRWMNMITPGDDQFWGLVKTTDSPEVQQRKVDFSLKLLKPIDAILEVEDNKGRCIWILINGDEADQIRGTFKEALKETYIKRCVIRNPRGDAVASYGGENPKHQAKLMSILAQVAYLNTEDFIDQNLTPHFKSWVSKQDPEVVERFYQRIRSNRIYGGPGVVYPSTQIHDTFNEVIRDKALARRNKRATSSSSSHSRTENQPKVLRFD